jgi:hypothetical protein
VSQEENQHEAGTSKGLRGVAFQKEELFTLNVLEYFLMRRIN